MTAGTVLLTFFLAQTSTAAAPERPLDLNPAGYVVRVDSSSVYLDFNEKSGASIGQSFIIYKEGDELTHPVTRKPLGRVEMKLAEGSVKEIHPGYSIGRVIQSFGQLAAGMRARLTPATEKQPSASAPPQTPKEPAGRLPRWKSPVFDYIIRAMAVADFKGDGKLVVAFGDERQIYFYSYPPQDNKPSSQYKVPGTLPRVLSLEAADLNGNGRAELFVTYLHETFNRVESIILELGPDGKWTKLAAIPWIVRGHQDGKGRSVLAIQQLEDDRTFPFSNIYPLEFSEGKYGPGKDALRFKRVDWIYGFTTADFDGTGTAPLYITSTDHLRAQFQKGYWRSEEAYGRTPVRFNWSGRILYCPPRMPARYTEKGFDAIYLTRNIAALGGLAGPFGLFSSAEISRNQWNGIGLASDWKAPLSGYSTALALVSPSNSLDELAVTVVGTSGKSSLWIYDP